MATECLCMVSITFFWGTQSQTVESQTSGYIHSTIIYGISFALAFRLINQTRLLFTLSGIYWVYIPVGEENCR